MKGMKHVWLIAVLMLSACNVPCPEGDEACVEAREAQLERDREWREEQRRQQRDIEVHQKFYHEMLRH